jgi:formyltetrahydrofolate deformylase
MAEQSTGGVRSWTVGDFIDAASQATSRVSDYVLTLSCPDQPGIVYSVAKFLADHGCNIVESQQFDDREADMFFMRVRFGPVSGTRLDLAWLQRDFADVAGPLHMSWRLLAAAERARVLIMVSKYGHSLNDLLFQANSGWLNIDVVAVVSNHPDLALLADNYDVPFHHIPVTADTKAAPEATLLELVADLRVDLVVLARYMQVLTTDLCKQLEGRAINIHH